MNNKISVDIITKEWPNSQAAQQIRMMRMAIVAACDYMATGKGKKKFIDLITWIIETQEKP